MAHQPVGDTLTITTSATSARAQFTVQSDTLRVVPMSQNVHVAIGTTATATTSDYFIPAGTPATLNIGRVSSIGIAGVTTGASTIIDLPEGTGCPFEAGDAVTLTVTNGGGGDQSYYNFSHKCVASVNTSAGVNGYFGTRCIINNNYGVGYAHTALSSSNYAELRGSFKVACLTSTGSGNAYIQQVQVSGDT